MNDPTPIFLEPAPRSKKGGGVGLSPFGNWFFVALFALLGSFALPLYRLARFALQSDLYSYVLLIPFVSAYLIRQRPKATSFSSGNYRALAVVLMSMGLVVLGGFWMLTWGTTRLVPQDSLALTTLSFVLFLAGICANFLDLATFRNSIFPLAFLVFMVPFPVALEQAIEMALQHGSAPPAFWFFTLAGTPVFKQELVFQLPGMTLQIAPECSGIRSTLVLFMTSLVAGQLFLRSAWRRSVLSLVVIPLALVRNGFRVFVIGELCVRVGPHMIDSPIHHQGGPIFFGLSLIPFTLIVYFLMKTDRRDKALSSANTAH